MTQPTRAKILQQALDATMKSRNQSYGDPYPNLLLAARLKALYQEAAGKKYSPAHDDAIHMTLGKIARVATGAVGHTDNYVDGAAYLAIAAECQEASVNEAVGQQNQAAGITPEEIKALLQCSQIEYEAEAQRLKNELFVQPGPMAESLSLVIEDPINRDTALPKDVAKEPITGLVKETPVEATVIVPITDPDSPRKQFMWTSPRISSPLVVSLGDWISFTPGGEEWCVVYIDNDNVFPTFTAQHAYNGRKVKHIPAHIYDVL